MTTRARVEARRNLDAINDATDNDEHGLTNEDYFRLIALDGIGYAILDLADAVREHTRKAKP